MIFELHNLNPADRILSLRNKTIDSDRYVSIEQAKIITRIYKQKKELPVILKRSEALAASLTEMTISIDPEELIVGNRTPDIRAGVVFPEAGIKWLKNEIDSLPHRPQDPFNVRKRDATYFKKYIEPFWIGKTLEDNIYTSFGEEISALEKVVKINQKDHAQGHICPKVEDWLRYGPAGLLKLAEDKLENTSEEHRFFYKSVCTTLKASSRFIHRFAVLSSDMAKNQVGNSLKKNLEEIADVCFALSLYPP